MCVSLSSCANLHVVTSPSCAPDSCPQTCKKKRKQSEAGEQRRKDVTSPPIPQLQPQQQPSPGLPDIEIDLTALEAHALGTDDGNKRIRTAASDVSAEPPDINLDELQFHHADLPDGLRSESEDELPHMIPPPSL